MNNLNFRLTSRTHTLAQAIADISSKIAGPVYNGLGGWAPLDSEPFTHEAKRLTTDIIIEELTTETNQSCDKLVVGGHFRLNFTRGNNNQFELTLEELINA